MLSINVKVSNPSGLHARPGARFAKECKKFQSQIELENKGQRVNAKSLIKLLSAGVCKNDVVTLHINGPDETLATDELVMFLSELKD